jgi:hypothetical protein
MGYRLPSDTDWVTASWYNHCCERNPPSSEPGTDYGSAYGSPLYACGSGYVVDLSWSNGGGAGRYIAIDTDDGRRLRSLHLSDIWVGVGQRVEQGQQIGLTGASGWGSDWGYGAHVHQTLWDYHGQAFCSSCTIDFENYVGTAQPSGTQRVVGANGANGRSDPSTANAVTQVLPPGTLANFNGWINGEVVSGNGVWFRGEFSGDWFWSGGFTDTGTHDLTDLNPAQPVHGNQRVVGGNGANGRDDPSTNGPVTQTLAPGTVADFDGWITGEVVEGNGTWFRGAHSGDYFWSGGFTETGTDGLTDLNSPSATPTTRTVGTNAANIRDVPFLDSPALSSAPGGTVVDMSGWSHGDAVEGNDVWFERKADGDWMWSGGFTSAATDGLTEKPTPEPPDPTSPDNPRGLPIEANYQWPLAQVWLDAPLGHKDCQKPTGVRESRRRGRHRGRRCDRHVHHPLDRHRHRRRGREQLALVLQQPVVLPDHPDQPGRSADAVHPSGGEACGDGSGLELAFVRGGDGRRAGQLHGGAVGGARAEHRRVGAA